MFMLVGFSDIHLGKLTEITKSQGIITFGGRIRIFDTGDTEWSPTFFIVSAIIYTELDWAKNRYLGQDQRENLLKVVGE